MGQDKGSSSGFEPRRSHWIDNSVILVFIRITLFFYDSEYAIIKSTLNNKLTLVVMNVPFLLWKVGK